MARFFAGYVGMNDPNLLALAIMAWALIWFIRCRQRGRSVIAAILLMVVAGFFKHTLLAVPATRLWLAMSDRRLALPRHCWAVAPRRWGWPCVARPTATSSSANSSCRENVRSCKPWPASDACNGSPPPW